MGWASYAEDVIDRHNDNLHTHEERPIAPERSARPSASRRQDRKAPRTMGRIRKILKFARPGSRADLASTVAELKKENLRQQALLAALEKDNGVLRRAVQRLENERRTLRAELARKGITRSRSRHANDQSESTANRRATSRDRKVRVWRREPKV
ncbi:hypothetical protein GCM10009609_43540 [Pseudonocardia aurantiaca]